MNMQKVQTNLNHPNFFQEVKNATTWRNLGEIFQKIIRSSLERNLLLIKNPNKPNSQKTLCDKIIKKINSLSSFRLVYPYVYRGEQNDFLTLVQSLPQPLSKPVYFIPGPRNYRLIDKNDDIVDYQLGNLKNCLIIKQIKQRYEQLIKNWDSARPLSVELSNWKPEELRLLSEDSSYHSRTALVNELNDITDLVLKHDPAGEKAARAVLEMAICANCPRIVSYLLSIIEIDHHSALHQGKDLFLLAMSIRPVNELDRTSQMEILKALYKARIPLSSDSFSAIIFHTLQHYLAPINPENQAKNHLLFDAIISSLLSATMNIKELVENSATYVGHLFGIKEQTVDRIEAKNPNDANVNAVLDQVKVVLQGDTLEGYFPEKYMSVHLRLFFQKIIETIKHSGYIDSRVIEEFLCELETGWVIHQSHKWFETHANIEDRKAFINHVLVKYVMRQIDKLSAGKEYVLYVLLPIHSIYVAFKKHADNHLEIRVDNLGGFSVGQRHVATLLLNPANRTHLKSYITSLFEISAECYKKPYTVNDAFWAEGNRLADRVYSPPQFPRPTQINSYPHFPLQTAGNCTHYSFLLGQCIRLNNENGSFFTSLPGIMDKIVRTYQRHPLHADPVQRSSVPYKTWLRQKLLNHYLNLEGNASPVPFMKSQILREEIILNSLCSSSTTRGHLLIEGAAGAGKTIFSQQLAYQLISKEELGSIVFYLPLRRLQQHLEPRPGKLIDLVELYILNRKLPFHEKKLLQTLIDDSSTIWILDGFDELIVQPHLEEALKALFQRKNLLITSRPHFSSKNLDGVFDLKKCNYIQMGDYTLEQKKELIDFHFLSFENQEHVKLKNDLKNILEKDSLINPHLEKMCEIPLSLTKVCQLLLSGCKKLLQETNIAVVTKMFISSLMINAHRRKKGGTFKSPATILQKYSPALNSIKKLAFKSLERERRTHFSIDVKNEVLPEDIEQRKGIEKDLEEIGLLQLDADGGQFVHATYQEYFAASYLVVGLKYHEATPKYQKVKEFITNHKNSPEYDQVFLYVAQIFKAKIQGSSGEKRTAQISLFMHFLTLYFSNLKQPLIPLVNITYEIDGQVPDDQVFKTFITNQINPCVKEIFIHIQFDYLGKDILNELQKLLLNHPHLKNDLELVQLIKEIPKDIGWTLSFINTFGMIMDLPFLLRFNPSPYQIFDLLKALNAVLPENAPLEQQDLDKINSLVKIALSSDSIAKHFSIVETIYEKLKGQMNLSQLFSQTIIKLVTEYTPQNQWSLEGLPTFIEFIKKEKPYSYIESEFIDCVANSQIKAIIPNFIHFLINYTSKLASTHNIGLLTKMKDWFCKIFNVYATQRDHSIISSSECYQSLKSLQTYQDPLLKDLIAPIFIFWDTIVVPIDLREIVEHHSLSSICNYLNSPPVIYQFLFRVGNVIQNRILALAQGSLQSNKRENRSRTEDWFSIRHFLANKNAINVMDGEHSVFVDNILEELINFSKINVDSHSDLPWEIKRAITGYQREETGRTTHDKRRMARIKNVIPNYVEIPQLNPPEQVPLIPIIVPVPKQLLKFKFDFSYCGYSDSLLQLHSLVLQNPKKWIHELTNRDFLEKLNALKDQLTLEIGTLADIANDPSLTAKKTKELDMVKYLLQVSTQN